MSTLELENIKHPDNANTNIALAADGKVGIGTTSPQAHLQINNGTVNRGETGKIHLYGSAVNGNVGDVSNEIFFRDETVSAWGGAFIRTIRTEATNQQDSLNFGTSSGTNGTPTTKLTINHTGNVGIGTNTPLRKLHLADAGDTHIILQSTNAVDNSEIFEIGAGANSASKVDLTFRTRLNSGSGGTEHMRITNDGYVTTPNQPVVFVSRTSTQAVTTNASAGTILDFTSTQYNIGGHFNISNNKFTAPITGRYEISWSYGTNVNGASVYRTFIWKNNNKLAYTQLRVDSNGHTGYVFGSRTAILELSANDYIELRASCDSGTDFYGDNELRIVMTIRLIG
jgi:hypothetical protein